MTVRTRSGGDSRGLVSVAWSGTDRVDGQLDNGTHPWTQTATPADGQGPRSPARGR